METIEEYSNWIINLIKENPIPAIFILIALLSYIYSSFFSKKALAKKHFKKEKASKIFNFKNGEQGKIIGKAECITSPLIAPLSGKKCVFYEVIVSRPTEDNNSVLIKKSRSSEFYIVNNTGKVLVNPKNAIYEIKNDIYTNSGILKEPNKKMLDFLKANDIESKTFLGANKSLTFQEKSIEVGELIGIRGKGLYNTSTNNTIEPILTFKNLSHSRLFISDNPETIKHN